MKLDWKARLARVDWKVWKPRLGYGGFALLAFVLSLRWTFPAEAVKQRLILEAGARGWQIEVGQVGPGAVLGVRATDVRLDDGSGLRIPLDEVSASLRLLPLLAGRQVLEFDGRVFDGRVAGMAQLNGDRRPFAFEVKGVDLARALPLRKATGIDLAGKLAGQVDVVLPGRPQDRATGRIDLTVTGAGVEGGQVPVPGMGGTYPLPKIGLGDLVAAVRLDQGKAVAEKLELRGGDAELTGEGLTVILQPRLEYAPLMGKARIALQPSLWTRSGTSGLKSIAELALAPSRTPDGGYQFAVFGTLGHPQLRPAGGP
ncbi:MAG TPA: type II secretion system protein GspN [Anaeromyxobacter sp.]|nr:type II secretion system protein GspN [Anaeromyxobacter sp.]